MGAFTPLAKVWYPDASDTAKPDTLLATLASSIENGLQPRLALQEKAVGIKASCPTAQNISTQSTIPYQVGSGNGQFSSGMSLSSSGVVTVQTPGQYLVTAMIGVQSNSYNNTRSVVAWIFHNSDIVAYCETPMSNSFTVSAQATVVMNCVAGDTIYVQGSTGGGATTGVLVNTAPYCSTFSVELIRPTPLVS